MSIVGIMLLIFVLQRQHPAPVEPAGLRAGAAAGLLWLLWSKLVKLHSRLQIALFETLDEQPDDVH
jgi:CPA2 family monovalent cation:H+ antiporter-2